MTNPVSPNTNSSHPNNTRARRPLRDTCLWAALAVIYACGADGADLQVSVHDLRSQPLMDAVVYAEPISGHAVASSSMAHASIDQVNKEFVPLVTVVRTNTEVAFPNSDSIRHSIYSFSQPKPFTTKLYSGKQAPPVLFDKPGVVVLGCNIHDLMAAWLVVVDTPYFNKSTAGGTAVLKDLEPGDYKLAVWYPGTQGQPITSQVHVAADSNNHVEVAVDSAGSPLPELRARAGKGAGKPMH